MEINKAMSICHKARIYIAGCRSGIQYAVVVTKDGKENEYNKKLTTNDELNNAIKLTYIHFAKKEIQKIEQPK